MAPKMLSVTVMFMLSFINPAFMQGSGTNGNLRLCVVRGRGGFNRPAKFCPVLDSENSGIECVLATDRLDCLRRISKGKVDFGVFSPEDLVAAQWANINVLVTNELRSRSRPFERSVVAVVNKRIQFDSSSSLHSILRNTTLCHPGAGVEDIRPLSDTIAGYLENLVTSRSCDPELSLAENRIKALADFFGHSCKAGPWVLDAHRDAELKARYPSLCAACGSPTCGKDDQFWGDVGALGCLLDRGDVAWAELDDVIAYFGIKRKDEAYANAGNFQYLCREGGSQPLETPTPCVWLHRPWPVIIATRKSAEAVAAIAMSLTNNTVVVDRHWHGALANLLEIHQAQPEPLHPPVVPMDYLARAKGFREAYSQSGCDPPRHVTLCTTSNIERNKCEWLSEASAVYGIVPPLQCTIKPDIKSCMEATEQDAGVVIADSNWLLKGLRDYSLQALLHEVTPIVDQTHTVVAYVKSDSGIDKMADLRGKCAVFPEYDGFAWHSVLRYLTNQSGVHCKDIKNYFSQICAPGIENANTSTAAKDKYTASCNKEDGKVLSGEIEALRALLEGKADVAFISLQTYNMYAANILSHYEWAKGPVKIKPVCPKENTEYCFISWSNLGHVFAAKNLTTMRKQEIINVFTKLDEHFGKRNTFHIAMFSMYGTFDEKMDVIFHNNTRSLATPDLLLSHPYDKIPLNFERSLSKTNVSCQLADFTNFGAKIQPSILLLVSLVFYFLSS